GGDKEERARGEVEKQPRATGVLARPSGEGGAREPAETHAAPDRPRSHRRYGLDARERPAATARRSLGHERSADRPIVGPQPPEERIDDLGVPGAAAVGAVPWPSQLCTSEHVCRWTLFGRCGAGIPGRKAAAKQ